VLDKLSMSDPSTDLEPSAERPGAQGKEGWLPEAEWRMLQQRIPVVCVDVLPLRIAGACKIEVGFIYRQTPHQGRRWCLVGGRLLRNELLRSAVIRQIREALGSGVRCILSPPVEPLLVAEYFSREVRGSLLDPRQHAISLTFAVQVHGSIQPTGEALDFRWFSLDKFPNSNQFGFGQKRVILDCVRRLDSQELLRISGRT